MKGACGWIADRLTHQEQRASETEIQRQERLDADRLAHEERLASETDNERSVRLDRDRLTHQEQRASETEIQRQERLDADRLAHEERLASETDNERSVRLDRDRLTHQEQRASETEIQRQERLDADRLAHEERLASETDNERSVRLDRDRLTHQEQRASETEIQRQERLDADRLAHEERLASETDDQRSVRLGAIRINNQEQRASETEIQRQERLDADRCAHEAGRASERAEFLQRVSAATFDMSPEELQEKLDNEDGYFDDFNTSIEKAVLLFYANSGLFRFDQYKDYTAGCDGIDIDVDKIDGELKDEVLTDKELQDLVMEFYTCHSYTAEKLVSCGACGIRKMERPCHPRVQFEKMNLCTSPYSYVFRYTKEEESKFLVERYGDDLFIPINDNWEVKRVSPWKAKSVFEARSDADGSPSYWHLHPELVDEIPGPDGVLTWETMLCPHCLSQAKAGKVPPRSIAAGIDFGSYHRLGLTLPSLHEQLIIARTRLYFAVIKACSNTSGASCNQDVRNILQCHAILFPHDAPDVAVQYFNSNLFGENGILNVDQMRSMLMLCLVDEKGKVDKLASAVFKATNIIGKPWVVAQWLLVLQRLNPHYFDLNVSEISKDRLEQCFSELRGAIMEEAVHITDPASVKFERQLGSDISHNQHREIDGESESIIREETATQFNDTDPCVRYTYITNKEQAYLGQDENDFRLIPLKTFVDNLNKNAADCSVHASASVQATAFQNTTQQWPDDDSVASHSLTDNSSETCSSVEGSFSDFVGISDPGGPDDNSTTAPPHSLTDNSSETCSSVEGSFSDFVGISDPGGPDDNSTTAPPENPFSFIDEKTINDYVSQCYANGGISARSSEPFSDYDRNDKGLATSFPHVFMLGGAYNKAVGGLSRDDRIHLLGQFSLVPAKDRRLLGFLFNVMQRARVAAGVKAYVEGNSHAIKTIEALLKDPAERERLLEAIRLPYLEVSKKLLNKYLAVLRFAGKDVPYGVVEGTKLKHNSIGSTNRYSPSTGFLTLSFENLSNPRSVRMAYRTLDNNQFPAQFPNGCPYGSSGEDFVQYMVENANVVSEGNVTLPPDVVISLSERAKLATENPVAFVEENKAILYDVMTILIGLPLENAEYYSKTDGEATRKTRYYRHRKGIFGYALSALGVTEDHQRGHLHWHLTINAGIPAFVLQRYANLEHVCNTISVVLDKMYLSKVTVQASLANTIQACMWKKRKQQDISADVEHATVPPEPLFRNPDAPAHFQSLVRQLRACRESLNSTVAVPTLHQVIVSDIQSQVAMVQFHRHQGTCHQRTWGKTGCRFNAPWPPEADTHATLLELNQTGIGADPNDLPENRDLPTLEELLGRSSKKARTASGAEPDLLPREQSPAGGIDSEDGSTTGGGTVNQEKPQLYTATRLMGSGAVDIGDNKHKLKPILDNTLPESVIVWETERPDNNIPNFLHCNLETDADRRHFIGDLKTYLKPIPPFNNSHSDFWKWLETQSSDSQVRELHGAMMERIGRANGYVATFNPILSFCTGSHNNPVLLGSLGQAKSAMFYIIPYQGKTKYEFQQSLTILNKALEHVETERFRSRAGDTGTLRRTMKHLLTRSLNRMHLQMELSDYQVAAALLELPSMIQTDRFAYGNPGALASFSTRARLAEHKEELLHEMFNEAAEARDRLRCRYDESAFVVEDDGNDDGDGPTAMDGATDNDNPSAVPYDANHLAQTPGFVREIKLRGPPLPGGAVDPHIPIRTMFVQDVALFLLRGCHLRKINYIEYLAILQFENTAMPKSSDGIHRSKNLKSPTRFGLSPLFEGFADCRHSICLKQKTPLMTSKRPPHPGRRPIDGKLLLTWKKKADCYAAYYLHLFMPLDIDTGSLKLGWDQLEDFIVRLQEDNSIISKFRLMMMDSHMQGLRTSEALRNLTLQHRARTRKIWTDEELTRYSRDSWRKTMTNQDIQDMVDMITGSLTTRQMKQVGLQLAHDNCQVKTLVSLYEKFPGSSGRHLRPGLVSNHILSTVNATSLQVTYSNMKDWKRTDHPAPTVSVGPDTDSTGASHRSRLETIRRGLVRNDGSNTEQLEIFDMYAAFLLAENPSPEMYPPNVVLLHGPPGVGKSKLRDAIVRAVAASGRYNLLTSFNAINATEMGGVTTSYLTNLNVKVHSNHVGDFKDSLLRNLRADGFNKDSFTHIEECSNQAPWHLARIHHLGCCSNNTFDRPFGGSSTTLYCDLSQLGPVRAGASLAQAVMDIYADDSVREWLTKRSSNKTTKRTILPFVHKDDDRRRINHPFRIGADIMIGARWFELTQQQRSIKDPYHTHLVNNNYKGEPVTVNAVKNKYKILSGLDCTKEEWIRAAVIVATNRERCSLTHTLAIQYATFFHTVIIRWLKDFKCWTQRPPVEFEAAALQDPCFYEYYVQDADGFLNENIMRDLCLVNAIPIVYHSIKFDPDTERWLRPLIDSAAPGDIITSPVRPICINAKLVMPPNTPCHVMEALRSFSIVPSQGQSRTSSIVIPVTEFPCKWDRTSTPVHGSPDFSPSKVLLRQWFPLELGFAVTVHKSEGRTLPRTIVALSYRPAVGCNYTFAQFNVAFSRVTKAEHMRLLLTGNNEVEQWRSLLYINTLRPDPAIQFYFSGFRNVRNNPRPNEHWKSNVWSAERANSVFKEYMGI